MSCSESAPSPGYNPDIGPFDENGNYIEAWADNPPKRGTKRRTSNPKPGTQPEVVKETTPKQTAQLTPRPTPKPVTKPAPKPRPKPVAKPKPKPKPVKVKPKAIRHVVKKGDTLYGLARKYGSTVSKIQKANGIRGTNIRDGSTLLIPR
jgi:LysM repeat protein